MARGSKPGERRGGRKKGTPNAQTAREREALKEAILGALEDEGGRAYLRRVAAEDARTFCALLGRIIPTQVEGTGKDGAFVIHVVNF